MNVRAALMLSLLVGVGGCAKSAAGTMSPDFYDYEELADGNFAEAAEMDVASESRRQRGGIFRRADAAGPPMAPGAAPEPEPTAIEGAGGESAASPGDSAEKAVADDTGQDTARHIIYTATMQVSVFNIADAMERAETLPKKYGGYVQTMSNDYFVMRIPSAKLDQAMDELATLGIVDNRTLEAQDVTEEFLDIETRIEVLESTQKQMLELLTKARTVKEALEVREALDRITMELEVLKGRLRRLENLTAYSTLTLSLQERGPHTTAPSSNDPFRWVDSLGVEATEWK